MKIIPYNKNLKEFARYLRNNSTLGEVLLWNALKGKQILGHQFYRQRPMNRYIVDFYCKTLNLVIEIDGSSHDSEEAQQKDMIRQEILEKYGVTFLRFADHEVKQNLGGVVEAIYQFANQHRNLGQIVDT